MSAELALTVSLSGLVGSLAAIGASYGIKRQKENTLRSHARALVKNELTAVREHLQYLANSSTQDKPIQMAVGTTSVEVGERMIKALEYPNFDTEIKLLSFDTEMLIELQNVYVLIKNISAFRVPVTDKLFEYTRGDIRRWLEDIDKVLAKLDQPTTQKFIHPPS